MAGQSVSVFKGQRATALTNGEKIVRSWRDSLSDSLGTPPQEVNGKNLPENHEVFEECQGKEQTSFIMVHPPPVVLH